MPNNSLSEISNTLLNTDKILILTHQRPDGDAIGSCTALYKALRKLNKKVAFYLPDPVQNRLLKYLDKIDIIKVPSNFSSSYSCFVALDCGDINRITNINETGIQSITINIDHHIDNSYFANMNYVSPKASSAAEIIYDLLKSDTSWKIDKEIADALLVGFLMDTGAFRFDNTTPDLLIKTADLFSYNIEYAREIQHIYLSKDLNILKLESDLILNYVKLYCNNKFAFCFLDKPLLEKYNVHLKEIDGLIDKIREIKDVIISAILYENNGGFRLSLRSSDPAYPINTIAQKYSGGGHKLAAGCNFKGYTPEHIEKMILGDIELLFNNQNESKQKDN